MECHRQLFVQDRIHFSSSGTVALVKILKTHINTKLGLKPYSAYGENTDNNYNKREFNAIQTPRHFPANQNQNQNNNHHMYQYQNNLPNTPKQQSVSKQQFQTKTNVQSLSTPKQPFRSKVCSHKHYSKHVRTKTMQKHKLEP